MVQRCVTADDFELRFQVAFVQISCQRLRFMAQVASARALHGHVVCRRIEWMICNCVGHIGKARFKYRCISGVRKALRGTDIEVRNVVGLGTAMPCYVAPDRQRCFQ